VVVHFVDIGGILVVMVIFYTIFKTNVSCP